MEGDESIAIGQERLNRRRLRQELRARPDARVTTLRFDHDFEQGARVAVIEHGSDALAPILVRSCGTSEVQHLATLRNHELAQVGRPASREAFTDLGNLVSGGLTLNGWSTLQNPLFTDALNTIVGYGYVNGQTTGQSVFVMTIPAPGAAGLLGLGGVLVARGRRRARGA